MSDPWDDIAVRLRDNPGFLREEALVEIERLRAIEEAAKVLIADVERTADVFEWFRSMAALRRAVHGWKEGE